MILKTGARLGPYEILAPLGVGGMGEVYRARDSRLGRDVAVKVLQDTLQDHESWSRFEREARAASALTHPNVCAVYDVGESEGRRFFVMELVDGVTLRQFLEGGPLDVGQALAFGVQIARALEAAHSKGIVHRDIKPGNIMIVGRRHLKVLDFGLATQTTLSDPEETVLQLTREGTVVGTPHYMAPEVVRGSRADARSDVWALGIVLYEMLCGRPPFSGSSAFEISSAIVHEPVPPFPATAPPGLRILVERCLAKHPDDRYQHVAEVAGALEVVQSIAGNAPGPVLPVTHRRARPLGWKGWVVTGAVAAAAVAALLLWPRTPETPVRRVSTGAPASANQEANEAFELALQFQTVQNDLPRGQLALERALALDSGFAEALRYHATNNAILILNGYSNDTSLLYKAEQELRQVAQLDPALPGLPSAFATVYLTQGRRELVPVDALDRALEQDPSHVNNRLWRGIVLWLAGSRAAAKQEFRTILDQRPLFGPARMFFAQTLREEGDLETAILEIEKVLEQGPNNITAIQWLTFSYLDRGDVARTRQLLEEKRPLFSTNYLWRMLWALLLAVEGDRDAALQAMDEETLKFAATAFVSTLGVAEFYAVLGDTSRAIEWLERTVRNGDERTAWFRSSLRLAGIRQDPRFHQIIDSVEARRNTQAGSR